MAIDVLFSSDEGKQPIAHEVKHNIESFFNILLCFCFRYQGPKGIKAPHPPKSPVDKWFETNQTYRELASYKLGQFLDFEESFLKKLPPYFADLKSCLHQLYNAIFPSICNARSTTHMHTKPKASNVTHAHMHTCWISCAV